MKFRSFTFEEAGGGGPGLAQTMKSLQRRLHSFCDFIRSRQMKRVQGSSISEKITFADGNDELWKCWKTVLFKKYHFSVSRTDGKHTFLKVIIFECSGISGWVANGKAFKVQRFLNGPFFHLPGKECMESGRLLGDHCWEWYGFTPRIP